MAENGFQTGEDSTVVEKCIPIIQQWIPTIPDLYGRTDEEFILKFLRNCKYDIERTKQKILRYYTNRNKYPAWLQNRDPLDEKIQELLKSSLFAAMGNDNRDPNNSLVVVVYMFPIDPQLLDALLKLEFMLSEVYNLDKTTQLCGVAMIADMKKVTAGMLSLFTPKFTLNCISCGLGGMPVKVKAIHLINTPGIISAFLSFIKIFLPEKLRKRIYVHGSDLDSLHKYFPANCLPLEYGGTLGPIKEYIDLLKKTLMDHRDYLIDDDRYGVCLQQSAVEPSRSLDFD